MEDLEDRASIKARRDMLGGAGGVTDDAESVLVAFADAEDHVGERGHEGGVMGGYENCRFAFQVPEDGKKPFLALAVHVGRRFVQNE